MGTQVKQTMADSDVFTLDDVQTEYFKKKGTMPTTPLQIFAYCKKNEYRWNFTAINKWWPKRSKSKASKRKSNKKSKSGTQKKKNVNKSNANKNKSAALPNAAPAPAPTGAPAPLPNAAPITIPAPLPNAMAAPLPALAPAPLPRLNAAPLPMAAPLPGAPLPVAPPPLGAPSTFGSPAPIPNRAPLTIRSAAPIPPPLPSIALLPIIAPIPSISSLSNAASAKALEKTEKIRKKRRTFSKKLFIKRRPIVQDLITKRVLKIHNDVKKDRNNQFSDSDETEDEMSRTSITNMPFHITWKHIVNAIKNEIGNKRDTMILDILQNDKYDKINIDDSPQKTHQILMDIIKEKKKSILKSERKYIRSLIKRAIRF